MTSVERRLIQDYNKKKKQINAYSIYRMIQNLCLLKFFNLEIPKIIQNCFNYL